MAKNFLSNGAVMASGTSSVNYVQQIAAEKTNFDIAVKNGIRFFNGQGDEEGLLWDGVSPVEIVIPTLSDIVANPVTLKGVVNSASDIPSEPSNGDLLYIGTTGSYFDPAVACEAGDMAVYYNNAWNVISGENQVSILGTEVSGVVSHLIGGTASSVLRVEGKDLSLALDYGDVYNHVKVEKNDETQLNVTGGKVNVTPMYVALSYVAGSSEDISTSMSIDLPSALADGTVTVDSVLQAADFTFTSGSFPTITKNSEVSVSASHNMSIAKSEDDGDFVVDVDAIKAVTFSASDSASANDDFSFVAGLSSISGKSFVSGVHAYTDADAGETADFSIWGQATVSNSVFVSGLGEVSTSGDLVSSITIGSVTLDAEGSGILTGINVSGSDFVTNVSFGTLGVDSEAQWFFSGLGEASTSGSVVTDVTVGAVTFVSGNSTPGFTGTAITSASVSNHVLTFTTGTFMAPVSISQAASTVSKADFVKSGVQLSGTGVSKAGFTSASLVQAASEVSYRNLLTDNVTLSQSEVSYFFDKADEHNYSAIMGYASHSETSATLTKKAAEISNSSITVTIPSNTFAVALSGGELPSLTIAETGTGSASGSVNTSLTTSVVSWLAVNESKKDVTSAGTYTLVSDSSVAGAISVGAADEYSVTNAKVTIAENAFVKDVYVNDSTVAVSVTE